VRTFTVGVSTIAGVAGGCRAEATTEAMTHENATTIFIGL
jgi:hypothetical protein